MTQSELIRRIEYVSIDELIAATNNPKKHSDQNIKDSIERFGYTSPVIIDERSGKIVAGHGRIDALKALRAAGKEIPEGIGEGWTVPVLKGWQSANDEEFNAMLVADNRLTELGGWDEQELFNILDNLDDLLGVGFTPEELKALDNKITELPKALTDPDDVPDPPKEPISQLGDIWILGNHRVICGDSTDVTVIDKLLCGIKADLIWTDPPYGVAYVGKTKDSLTIENDNLDKDKLRDFLYSALDGALLNSKPGACWYVASPPGPISLIFGQLLNEIGILRQQIIWMKDAFVLGHSDYHYRHEPIFYGWTPGAAHHAPPTRDQDTIWEIARPKRNKEHPTMKPVELIERAIRNSTAEDEIVLDMFGGSGSTLIACEATRRKARLIELEPKYVDVICKRYQERTELLPVLESTQMTVNFIK